MSIELEPVFEKFLDECSRMSFKRYWSEKRLKFDWHVLEVYLDQPEALISTIVESIRDNSNDKVKQWYEIRRWLRDNGIPRTTDRIHWVKSIRDMADSLINLISAEKISEHKEVLQNFYEFSHRTYQTQNDQGSRSWSVQVDKKAFFMLLLKKLEAVKPPVVPIRFLTQAQDYLYLCERSEADTLLHRFNRALMEEFGYTPPKLIDGQDLPEHEQISLPETTIFDEDSVDREKTDEEINEEVEILRHQISELWIEREQIPIRFEEYQEEVKQAFIWDFYQKIAENGLFSRLLSMRPKIEVLTSQRYRGNVPQEDYVFTVLRLFLRFLTDNNLRISEKPKTGDILQIQPEDRSLFDFEGKLPDEDIKIEGRVIHPEVSVFSKVLLKPRIQVID